MKNGLKLNGSAEFKILEQMVKDIGFMKQKILLIEQDVREINDDLHEVRPEYLEKLKKIDSGEFVSRKQFKRELHE